MIRRKSGIQYTVAILGFFYDSNLNVFNLSLLSVAGFIRDQVYG